MIITICSSASFYKQAVEAQAKIQSARFQVVIPANAETMKQNNDYEVSHYKTWFAKPGDYHKKAEFMRNHFLEIEKGDVILVLNYQKHGVDGYIGGNVLIEMALAFYLKKPIYILNQPDPNSAYLEEILGMEPLFLDGELSNLADKLY